MNDLPLPVLYIINFVIFFVYYFIGALLIGFILTIFGIHNVDGYTTENSKFYSQLTVGAYFWILLIVTIIYRKTFYITKNK